MNRVSGFILCICFFFFAVGVTRGLSGCQKAKAAPRPAQVFALAGGCADTAGVYTPTLTGAFNAGSPSALPAHFTRVCDEVFVSGVLSGSISTDTIHKAQVNISLPIPSDLTTPPITAYGQATILQNSVRQPLSGSVSVSVADVVTVFWNPTSKNGALVIYSFSYTVK